MTDRVVFTGVPAIRDCDRILAVAILRLLQRSNRDDDLVNAISERFGIDLVECKNTGREVGEEDA